MDVRLWIESHRRKLVLVALLPALAALAVAAAVLLSPAKPAPADPAAVDPAAQGEAADQSSSSGGLLVEVSGAVASPGLYRMPKGERVHAAITAAGGLSARADPARLPNMAERLRDGQQIIVPPIGGAGAGRSAASTRSVLVDLNSATAEELAGVPGFTPEMAAAAVSYRSQYGGFTSSRELVTILGMSEAEFSVARKYLHT
jgi:competence protein ComEA